MHPALSIVAFTTASGAGYGILIWCGLLALLGRLPASPTLTIAACGIALALVSAGLLSSLLHLGRPERAWRALSQWRSSWLSREGVLALLGFPPALVFAAVWALAPERTLLLGALGLATLCIALATIGCTAMIYASLKPVPQWRSPWVLPAYLALALMTGAVLLAAILLLAGFSARGVILVALAAIIAAALIKEAYWSGIGRETPASTIRTATGLGRHGRVTAFEAPHTEENYLLREMGFRIARKHAARLRLIARICAFALPFGLALVALPVGQGAAAAFMVLAALSAGTGVLVERWLFFAEAKHAVTLYYGGDLAVGAPEALRGTGRP